MKATAILMAALAAMIVSPVSLGEGPPASYVNESVQALQSGNVYVSDLATEVGSDTKDHLEKQIGNSDIAVAILPASASTETGGKVFTFVSEIAEGTGHQTVVVAVGNDLEAGSSSLPAGLAGQYANSAEQNNGSVEKALVEFIGDVKNYTTADTPPAGNDGGGFPVITVALVLAIAASGSGAVVGAIRRSKRLTSPEHVSLSRSPEKVKELLEKLLSLRNKVQDPQLRGSITDICRDMEVYFKSARSRGKDVSSEALAFQKQLESTVNVLEKYLEIQTDPRYFPNAETDKENGAKSITDYAEFVLKSVQQAEARELTDFKVDTKILSAQKYQFPDK
jgi:hypothetical protein